MATVQSPRANGVATGLMPLLPKGLPKIVVKPDAAVCTDDTTPNLRVSNVDELHSLQKKRSQPSTPKTSLFTDEERQQQQLESISASLASLTRERGPQVARGDPAKTVKQVSAVPARPTVSDSALKLTHVLYNLSPAGEGHSASWYKPGSALRSGLAARWWMTGLTPRLLRPLQVCILPGGNRVGLMRVAACDLDIRLHNGRYAFSLAELYEFALKNERGSYFTSTGALATLSGAKTGRSPKDKRVVREEITEDDLWWGKGSPNIEMDEETFLINRERAVDYLNSLEKVFVNDQFLNWDPEHRIKVRIISARAYHSLFMHNMCIRPTAEELENFGKPDFTIYNAGQFPCNRFTHYMTSSTSIDLNLKRREMVILGTQYAGEMKKGLFSVMHYLMPKKGVLSLHSGCNMGKDGDVALFFGLSGTGKTTLSTDHNRFLIGDDEHCWTDTGVSNIEGGCYAKTIDLCPEKEPDIFQAIKFGTVLENVVFDEHTREVDYYDKSVTENTRAAYPIEFIKNALLPCVGPHPKNVILLACDAFGVLPPVSKLTLAQTMYHFISGYTALVAGTEDGIKEPQATFSACFGAAFIMWHPTKYASMLAEKMQRHGATAWLVNTGWYGGSYGVGSRMKLPHTRKIIDAIHNGSLLKAKYTTTPIFNLNVPSEVDGVPSEVLRPENMWTDKSRYNATLKKLAGLFVNNFEKFADHKVGKLTEEILAAGPNI